MSEVIHLQLNGEKEGELLLPEECSLSVACYEWEEVRRALAMSMEQILYALALVGMDLRALDRIMMSHGRADAIALQRMPDGQIPLGMTTRDDTMEMARTVSVNQT